MAVAWRSAPSYVIDIAQDLIARHHEHLKEARIGFLLRSEAPRNGGRVILGAAKRVPTDLRVWLDYDFIIWLAADQLGLLTAAQREALIDHELCHCTLEDHLPKLIKHDVEEFACILARHGFWWPGAKPAADAAAIAIQQGLLPADEPGNGRVEAVDVSGEVIDRIRALKSMGAEFMAPGKA